MPALEKNAAANMTAASPNGKKGSAESRNAGARLNGTAELPPIKTKRKKRRGDSVERGAGAAEESPSPSPSREDSLFVQGSEAHNIREIRASVNDGRCACKLRVELFGRRPLLVFQPCRAHSAGSALCGALSSYSCVLCHRYPCFSTNGRISMAVTRLGVEGQIAVFRSHEEVTVLNYESFLRLHQ
jgi:hypothetical protein